MRAARLQVRARAACLAAGRWLGPSERMCSRAAAATGFASLPTRVFQRRSWYPLRYVSRSAGLRAPLATPVSSLTSSLHYRPGEQADPSSGSRRCHPRAPAHRVEHGHPVLDHRCHLSRTLRNCEARRSGVYRAGTGRGIRSLARCGGHGAWIGATTVGRAVHAGFSRGRALLCGGAAVCTVVGVWLRRSILCRVAS